MFSRIPLLLLALSHYSHSFPNTLSPRARTCSPTVPTFPRGYPVSYAVQNNVWGAVSTVTDKQCSQIDSFAGTNLAWASTFSWNAIGPDDQTIKTYANAESDGITTCLPLTQRSTLKTTWEWRYILLLFPPLNCARSRVVTLTRYLVTL